MSSSLSEATPRRDGRIPAWLLLVSIAGCKPGGEPAIDPIGAWASANLVCEADRDCLPEEACEAGVCRLVRCEGIEEQASAPPVGIRATLWGEDELAFASTRVTDSAIEIFQPAEVGGTEAEHVESVPLGASPALDLAGGRLDGSDRGSIAIVQPGGQQIVVPSLELQVDLTLAPVAIAAGDVDGDGFDEVIAVSAARQLEICDLTIQRCDPALVEGGGIPVDLAAGDIDGDGFDEAILLMHLAGEAYLYVVHPHATDADADHFTRIETDAVHRITTGDDGSGSTHVIALKDRSCPGSCDDELLRYDLAEEGGFVLRHASPITGRGGVEDIAAGDVDGDGIDEVVTVSNDGLATLEHTAPGGFSRRSQQPVAPSLVPDRVALIDHDGDAVQLALTDGPEPAVGGIVPLLAMVLPPYSHQGSAGVSRVGIGDELQPGADTITLEIHPDVGTPDDLGPIVTQRIADTIFGIEVNPPIEVSPRYTLSADPDSFGDGYGGVALGWGCFETYRYALTDPAGATGADGATIAVAVPIGGGDVLYSTPRYSTLAEALHGLPPIEVPYVVGDPASYPPTPERLDRSPIPDEAMLFTSPQALEISGTDEISWRDVVGDVPTNEALLQASIGAATAIEAHGATIDLGDRDGWSGGYRLRVGEHAVFSGSIPGLSNDPASSQDGQTENRYTVSPRVYQQTYSDPAGAEGAYWIMTYTVGE